jgi:hypothetical protein
MDRQKPALCGLLSVNYEKTPPARDQAGCVVTNSERVFQCREDTFSVTERSARTGRNPQTGKEIMIAAKKVARFKAGTALSSALNKAQPAPAKAVRSKPGKNLKDSTK